IWPSRLYRVQIRAISTPKKSLYAGEIKHPLLCVIQYRLFLPSSRACRYSHSTATLASDPAYFLLIEGIDDNDRVGLFLLGLWRPAMTRTFLILRRKRSSGLRHTRVQSWRARHQASRSSLIRCTVDAETSSPIAERSPAISAQLPPSPSTDARCEEHLRDVHSSKPQAGCVDQILS
ncbi:hypothetical protein FPSE5266_20177, partial [Fusarium pseudograminearum]